mmetsp:Transcript_7069/g.12615  ORF Transcript_7069/g.12615 Transcript_7069/m.12615 type:complete len:341 (-) Transcript_7069:704-1726(-)
MLRGVGHGATFKPAVEHLINTFQHAFPHLGRNLNVIDEVTVNVRQLPPRVLLQLFDATDANNLLEIRRDPQRNRRSPVAISRHTPISSLREPVVKAFRFHVIRHPVRFVVACNQILALFLHFDEPTRHSLVNQRSVRTPAVWVVVNLVAVEDKLTFLLQPLLDIFVSSLDMLAFEVGNLICVAAIVIDRADHTGAVLFDDASCEADAVIVFTKGWCLVDDAGTGLRGDVAICQDGPSFVKDLALKEVEKRLVSHAFDLASLLLPKHVKVLLGVLFDGRADPSPAILTNDPLHSIALVLHLQVRQLLIDAKSDVGRQGPRGRCPCQDVGVLLMLQLELNDD